MIVVVIFVVLSTIDWAEFLDFFHHNIVPHFVADWNHDGEEEDNGFIGLAELMNRVCSKLSMVLHAMEKNGWKSVENYLSNVSGPACAIPPFSPDQLILVLLLTHTRGAGVYRCVRLGPRRSYQS